MNYCSTEEFSTIEINCLYKKESFYIFIFKNLDVFEGKVAENYFFLLFSVTLTLNDNYLQNKSLKKVTLNNYDIPNRIVQIYVLTSHI